MTEIVFLIEDDPGGGYNARSLGESIFTQADDMEHYEKWFVMQFIAIFPMSKIVRK